MPSGPSDAFGANSQTAISEWRDRKRYLWLLGVTVPTLVASSWIAVRLTGLGVFWWSGPIVILGIIPLLDFVVGSDATDPPADALGGLQGDRFYRWVLYLYLPNQYLSLLFACWLWSGGGGVTMTAMDKLGLMATVGFIAGIGINAAHELGHKRARAERWLSKIALAQTGYGHFFVDHNRGHHVRVATAEDPASSRLGESVYSFIPRSVLGSLRCAWELEGKRLSRQGKSRWTPRNDVLNAWLMTLALVAVLLAWFGVGIAPWLCGQAVVGFWLLETVSYLEHYGLRRQKRRDGRYERVRPSHSWNSNTVIANLFLFHVQRHSDHHENPLRPYQSLHHADEAPQLPAGYGTMLVLAYFPPLWRRVMDPRVLHHYGGDIRLAALSPRLQKQLLERSPGRHARRSLSANTPSALTQANQRTTVILRLAAEAGLRRAEIAQVHDRDLFEGVAGAQLLVHGKGRRRHVALPSESPRS